MLKIKKPAAAFESSFIGLTRFGFGPHQDLNSETECNAVVLLTNQLQILTDHTSLRVFPQLCPAFLTRGGFRKTLFWTRHNSLALGFIYSDRHFTLKCLTNTPACDRRHSHSSCSACDRPDRPPHCRLLFTEAIFPISHHSCIHKARRRP